MAKKKYVKPMMVSEEFVPNEYVAACEVVVGTIFDGTLECGGNVKIKITSTSTSPGTLQGNPVVGDQPQGTYETIYIDQNTGEYVYGGSVEPGHDNYTKPGEWVPIGGACVTGQQHCKHVLNTPAAHHHYKTLTITNKNNS